jgi:hypothetical protein
VENADPSAVAVFILEGVWFQPDSGRRVHAAGQLPFRGGAEDHVVEVVVDDHLF